MRRLDLVERDRAHARSRAEDDEAAAPLPAGARNYITPAGHARLKAELEQLLDRERPELVKVVAWAAANGDRSENADYQYGKRRLREIDRRIRFLTCLLERADVVDPLARDTDQVFFGATVTYLDGAGSERTVAIVGADEVDTARGRISWLAPVARALMKSRAGEVVTVRTPGGREEIEVVAVRYVAID
jgi:transcription elongation factor GreB